MPAAFSPVHLPASGISLEHQYISLRIHQRLNPVHLPAWEMHSVNIHNQSVFFF
jgi:hypothetical protein